MVSRGHIGEIWGLSDDWRNGIHGRGASGPQAGGMTVGAPAHYLGCSPVNVGIVESQPGLTKDYGSMWGGDYMELDLFVMITRDQEMYRFRAVSNSS